jgi:hypothetical protein
MPYAGPPGRKFLPWYVDVGARWPAAVKALSMAIWIDVSLALGMRVKCSRCRVLSTRAMLKSMRDVR